MTTELQVAAQTVIKKFEALASRAEMQDVILGLKEALESEDDYVTEYELRVNDEFVASTTSAKEAAAYAMQYTKDGPVDIYERRTLHVATVEQYVV